MDIKNQKNQFRQTIKREIMDDIIYFLGDKLPIEIKKDYDEIMIGNTLMVDVFYYLDESHDKAKIVNIKPDSPKLNETVETDICYSNTRVIANVLAEQLEEVILRYGIDNIE